MQQIRDSGITFSPLAGTVMVWIAETDPRPVMSEIVGSEQGGIWQRDNIFILQILEARN